MFGNKGVVALMLGASVLGLPAFAQSEEYKSDVTVQALGSFVKDSTDNGVTHSASNSGGVLGTYRYYFGRHNGVEFNYGYTLNSQRYALNGNVSSTPALLPHSADKGIRFRLSCCSRCRGARPAVLAGGGAWYSIRKMSAATLARPTFVYGAGADFDLGSRWFVRAQYRGLVYNSPTLAVSTLSAEILTHRAEPSVGFGFRF